MAVNMDKIDILSLNLEELTEAIVDLGLPKFRAGQIYKWLHVNYVTTFNEMTNISLQLRNKLNDSFVIFSCSIEKKQISEYDDTMKYLFRLHDGEYVETVVMKYKYGYSVCVSSQVGCKMGCKFCASTLSGVVRNLSASEILSQVYTAARDNSIRISHIVLMGMGEPFDNYDNVVKFLRLITDENGSNISMRHISLSTCGVVTGIYKLMELDLQLTLSISLHAPYDELRSSLMPVNKKWGINELIKACKDYTNKTGRRISFEYTLISGVNDTDECACRLAALLSGMLCHVNLIPVNEVSETQWKGSSASRVAAFTDILTHKGINATVRRKLGSDISAACGQLRRNSMKGS